MCSGCIEVHAISMKSCNNFQFYVCIFGKTTLRYHKCIKNFPLYRKFSQFSYRTYELFFRFYYSGRNSINSVIENKDKHATSFITEPQKCNKLNMGKSYCAINKLQWFCLLATLISENIQSLC